RSSRSKRSAEGRFGTVWPHSWVLGAGTIERMFVAVSGAVEEAREARWCRIGVISEEQARMQQELTEIVRAADDAGDWRAAGFSSSAVWFAQASRSDHRTAMRITQTSD